MSRVLAGACTAALWMMALFGLMDFLVQGLWLISGWHLVRTLAAPFALTAILLANVLMVAAVFTPRVPLRVAAPLWGIQAYIVLGAMPFGVLVYVYPSTALLSPLFVLASAALAGLAASRLPHATRFGVSQAFVESRSAFSAGRTVGLLLALVLAVPPLTAAYLGASAAWTLSYATAGHAGFTSEGFVVRGRSFERDGVTVVLQGMMHIGEGRAYEDLYASFAGEGRTVVLTEGVSDDQDLLGRGGIGYGKVAERLGLEQQHAVSGEGFEVRNADVDVSTFDAESLALLRSSFAIWTSDDPVGAWARQAAELSGKDPNQLYGLLYQDLVVGRNEHLLEEVEDARAEFQHIVVPWGAAHMPGLTASLLEQGYVPGEWTEQLLWSWGTVGSALR